MITRKQLDDVVARVNRILINECRQDVPFVLIILEPFASKEEVGMSMRATGNTNQEMARDMITKAAMHILETEYEPPQSPESLQ